MTRYIAATIAVILLILVAIFSFQNLEIIDVRFLSLSVSLPTFVIVIAAYVLGMITGGSVVAILRKARKLRSEQPAKKS